jgi:hypothetical protein
VAVKLFPFQCFSKEFTANESLSSPSLAFIGFGSLEGVVTAPLFEIHYFSEGWTQFGGLYWFYSEINCSLQMADGNLDFDKNLMSVFEVFGKASLS